MKLENFKEHIRLGVDKDKIIQLIALETGKGIISAVSEYKKLAREAGILLTTEARKEAIKSYLKSVNTDLTDASNRTNAAQYITLEFDLSEATAMQHVRDFCLENGIEVPTQQRTKIEVVEKVVLTDRSLGIDRAVTVKKIADEFGISETSAAAAYSKVLGRNGLKNNSGPRVPVATLVAAIIHALTLDKAKGLEHVVKVTGYSETTARNWLNVVPFAEEYARQTQK